LFLFVAATHTHQSLTLIFICFSLLSTTRWLAGWLAVDVAAAVKYLEIK